MRLQQQRPPLEGVDVIWTPVTDNEKLGPSAVQAWIGPQEGRQGKLDLRDLCAPSE